MCSQSHYHVGDTEGHTAWWRHQTETFSALLALCAGNSPVPVNSPHKGQWRGGALMFSLICVWINIWVNNREAGDLRCHRAHYNVAVMWNQQVSCHNKAQQARSVWWLRKRNPQQSQNSARVPVDHIFLIKDRAAHLIFKPLQACDNREFNDQDKTSRIGYQDQKTMHITMISHARHGVTNHQQLDFLFNSLTELVTREKWKLHISGTGRNPPVTGIPYTKGQ